MMSIEGWVAATARNERILRRCVELAWEVVKKIKEMRDS